MSTRLRLPAAAALLLAACSPIDDSPADSPSAGAPSVSAPASPSPSASASGSAVASPEPASASVSPVPETHEFEVTEHETFDEPWAMTFLPGTDAMVITERRGVLLIRDDRGIEPVTGTPESITVAGQGGLGDIIAGPTFAADGTVYLSWVNSDSSGRSGAVVGRGRLDVEQRTLTGLEVIWRQVPKTTGDGHFGHRLAVHDGHLYVTSGERRQMTPAQDLDTNLGAILRLTLDGDPAPGNPWAGEGDDVTDELWSKGHRNPLGISFDADGRLWETEMGPMGGDELNLIEAGSNYGWPEVSNGTHYDGTDIPDHAKGDGFVAPKVWWNPSISPGSLLIYQGDLFPAWTGDAFIGALSGEALIRVNLDGVKATEKETWSMDARIRAVAEAPDGSIWLLQDGEDAKLLALRPA